MLKRDESKRGGKCNKSYCAYDYNIMSIVCDRTRYRGSCIHQKYCIALDL